MKYRNTNDIHWVDFQQFLDEIKDREDDEQHLQEVIQRIFKTDDFDNLNKALQVTDMVTLPFKIDMSFKDAAKFIDCDTLLSENNMIDFLKLVLKKKYFWSKKINFDKITVAQATYVSSLFTFAPPR